MIYKDFVNYRYLYGIKGLNYIAGNIIDTKLNSDLQSTCLEQNRDFTFGFGTNFFQSCMKNVRL